MLEYDNSAFYYFSITLLTIYIIPGTWYALSEVFHAFFASVDTETKPRTSAEVEKADKLKKESTGFARLKNTTFLVNLVLLVICWVVFLYLISLVRNDGEVSTFDPFTILGIQQDASISEIKKAYRKLSLLYHPDKNIGNKKAEELFMKVAKAYEALTDETSKENYQKYGNPDGKQALEVSIGLPRILLDNPKVVLILYLIGMVVLIPVVVGLWYSNSKQYGEKNILYETYAAIYQLLQANHRTKHMPEIVAASAECRSMYKQRDTDSESIRNIFNKLKNDKLMIKPKFEHEIILRGNLLLHAHVLRFRDQLNDDLRRDLDELLIKTPEIVDGIIEIAFQRRWLEVTLSAIRFSQCIIQGLWYTSDPLEQLPHLSDVDIKTINKSSKILLSSLVEFLRTADDNKKGISDLSSDQKKDLLKACSIFPILKVDTKLFVEEEDEVAEDEKENSNNFLGNKVFEQDLVTLKVVLTHENVSSSPKVPSVYAPLFPKIVHENWWIILADRQSPDSKKPSEEVNIHAIEKVATRDVSVTHLLKFMAPPTAGTYELELHVVSDCYLGLDQKIDIKLEVNPASELPEYVPHPEDVELDNEPTLFEQMMAANIDEDSSDDDDDEDDNHNNQNMNSSRVEELDEEDEDD